MTRKAGVVLKGTGGIWHVRAESGETHEASLRGRLKQEREETKKLAVGDRVVLEIDERGGHWAIAEILPRHSQLARRAPGEGQGERIVAANVDQVVIVFAAAKPEPHRRMLDRFLVIAEANSLESHVVINKIELVDRERTEGEFADYAAAGYPMHFTSVKPRKRKGSPSSCVAITSITVATSLAAAVFTASPIWSGLSTLMPRAPMDSAIAAKLGLTRLVPT